MLIIARDNLLWGSVFWEFVEVVVVPPVHPGQGGSLDLATRAPRAKVDQLGLV